MSLKQRVVKLERHRDGGRFIYLTTRPNETVEAALARKGVVLRERDYVLAHAGFEKERESAE
ncbi:MAG: hypothetical protein V9H25_18830 [Candidatus Competibacter sp.]